MVGHSLHLEVPGKDCEIPSDKVQIKLGDTSWIRGSDGLQKSEATVTKKARVDSHQNTLRLVIPGRI